MTHPKCSWAAHASGSHPHDLAKACVGQLDGMVDDANLGLIFLAGNAAEMANEVIDILRQSLKIEKWFGGCGDAIIAGPSDITGEGGLAVLCLALPESGTELIRALPTSGANNKQADNENQTIWLCASAEHEQPFDVTYLGSADIGGFCVNQHEAPLILNQPVAGGAVGLRINAPLQVTAGMSRGTRDLGPWRRITSSVGGSILELDGEPAAGLVEVDTGELLARQPDRLIRQVIVETCDDGQTDILMPRLALIECFERSTGRLQIRDRRPGNMMRLVYRQPGPAREELSELARALLLAAGDRQVLGALLFSSHMRGEKLFGPENQEPVILTTELGSSPLIGLRTSDELYRGQSTCGAAVLMLITFEAAK